MTENSSWLYWTENTFIKKDAKKVNNKFIAFSVPIIRAFCLYMIVIAFLILIIPVSYADLHSNIWTTGTGSSNAPFYNLNMNNITNVSNAHISNVIVETQGYYYYQSGVTYTTNGRWENSGNHNYYGEGSVSYTGYESNKTWTSPMHFEYNFDDSTWSNNKTTDGTLLFIPYDTSPNGGFSNSPLGYFATDLNSNSTYNEPIVKMYLNWKNAYNKVYGNTINSTYGNITINTKRLGTTTNIQNALVQYTYNGGINTITGRTDINGNVSFYLLPNSVIASPLEIFSTGYNYYIENIAFINPENFHQVYLTPTGLPNSTNNLQLQIRDSISGLFLGDIGIFPQSYSIFDFNGSKTRSGTTNTSIIFLEYGGDASKQLIYGDTYNLSAWATGYNKKNITYTHNSGNAVQSIYLSPSGYLNQSSELWVDIIDGSTGGTIGGSTFGIYDYITHEWWNTTSTTGELSISFVGKNKQNIIELGNQYKLFASAAGYDSIYKVITFSADKQLETLSLTYSSNVPSGNFSLNVYASKSDNAPLSGVSVLLSNGQGHTTGTNGYTQFILPAGSYSIRGRLSGYTDSTAQVTGTDGESKTINLVFVVGSTTPTPTPVVSQTIVGFEPSEIQDEVSCNSNPQFSLNIVGIFKNFMACSGVKGKQAQNLFVALGIIIICGMILGKYGKGIGVLAGVIAGSVISFALMLIPMWIMIFVLIVCGLIFAKMFVGGK